MSDIFNITQCNLAQLIAESNRFLFQVLLVHVTTCIIEGKKEIFSETLFKSLLITAMAIVMYHIFFRKMVEPKLEKMKTVCSRSLDERRDKITKLHKRDPLRPKYRRRIDRRIRENAQAKYENEFESSERPERPERPERSERSRRYERPERSRRSERSERSSSRSRSRRSPESRDVVYVEQVDGGYDYHDRY
jgi:hypothetical protein